ncbi:MAG: hypothetical protein ACK4QP_12420 [Pseudorhizobium sp.]
MDTRQRHHMGEVVQNYIRRKLNFKEHWSGTGDPTTELDEALRERIYLLGVDDKLLLEVQPEAVFLQLEELEAAAVLEDGGYRKR